MGVSTVARSPRGFLPAYRRAGNVAALPPEWRAKRDAFVARHEAQVRQNRELLWTKDGAPTRRHLALAVWARSPDPGRLSAWLRREGFAGLGGGAGLDGMRATTKTECPLCGKLVYTHAITRAMYAHGTPGSRCPGSGRTASEVRVGSGKGIGGLGGRGELFYTDPVPEDVAALSRWDRPLIRVPLETELAKGAGATSHTQDVDYFGFVAILTPKAYRDLNPSPDLEAVHWRVAGMVKATQTGGVTFGIPAIYVEIAGAVSGGGAWTPDAPVRLRVTGHEGRHRARMVGTLSGWNAAMPVAVITRGVRARSLTPAMLAGAEILPDSRSIAHILAADQPVAVVRRFRLAGTWYGN